MGSKAANGRLAGLMIIAALMTASCGGGSEVQTASVNDKGTLSVEMTSTPGCGLRSVAMTVEAIRLHSDAGVGSGGPGWEQVDLERPTRAELLDLSNGSVARIALLQLPAADYQQLELVLASNEKGAEPAHTVQLITDPPDTRRALIVPDQTPLTIPARLTIASDQMQSLVLDFDACRSIVPASLSQAYRLDPQVRPVFVGQAGKREIAGELDPSLAGAIVSAQIQRDDGMPELIKSTVVAADGLYVLSPLPDVAGGSVTLVIRAPNKPVHMVTDVPVAAGQKLSLPDMVLRDADQDPFVTGLAVGTVTMDDNTGATVSLIQMLGTTAVELDRTPVDAQTGSFALDLPGQLPWVGRWDPDSVEFEQAPAPDAPGSPALVLRAERSDDSGLSRHHVIGPQAPEQAIQVLFDLTDSAG